MRILGLDLGTKRIGLAISDSEAAMAFPAGVHKCVGRKQDVAALCALIEEREVERAVVGLPRHMDGRRGPEAEAAEAFAEALRERSGIPVELLDERWTSAEAERILHAQAGGARTSGRKKRGERKSGRVDELAASIILQTYLDLLRNRAREGAGEDRR